MKKLSVEYLPFRYPEGWRSWYYSVSYGEGLVSEGMGVRVPVKEPASEMLVSRYEILAPWQTLFLMKTQP